MSPSSSSTEDNGGPRPLKRILIVDDDPDLLAVAKLLLGGLVGYTVKPCLSAREAVDQAPSFKPDLILLDVRMPETDGFATLKALREIEATARTPVVFMTADSTRYNIARYSDPGCLGVISKLFDAMLPRRIEALWGRHCERLAETHPWRFEALRQAYVDELAIKIAAMRAAGAIVTTEGWDRSAVESLFHLAHRMAGSSGLYGLPALSRSAGALEEVVKRLLSGPSWPPSSSPLQLAALVKAVERAARREAAALRQPKSRGRRAG
jgi:CheY-like chemotaxis protein